MRILAIDHGEKRIGLAISDELCLIAKPMPIMKVKSLSDAVSKLAHIVKKQNIDTMVIGLALGIKGEETQQSIQTRYFANALKSTNGITLKFWNEAFSTKEAREKASGRKKRNIDSEAARIILQEFLDEYNEEKKSPLREGQHLRII